VSNAKASSNIGDEEDVAFYEDEKMPYDEAKERATAETLKEGKFHGISKMAYDICQITQALEDEEKAI